MSGATSTPAVSLQEAADLFRRALRGEVAVTLDEPEWTWAKTYCGVVGFRFGGWLVEFFNDCDELDYTDSIVAQDGRRTDFEDWAKPGDGAPWCPLDLLTKQESDALELLLEAAR